jgi:hypothetical protein
MCTHSLKLGKTWEKNSRGSLSATGALSRVTAFDSHSRRSWQARRQSAWEHFLCLCKEAPCFPSAVLPTRLEKSVYLPLPCVQLHKLQLGRFRWKSFKATATYMIKIAKKKKFWPSVGEALSSTSTELQRKIDKLRNKFFIWWCVYFTMTCKGTFSVWNKLVICKFRALRKWTRKRSYQTNLPGH